MTEKRFGIIKTKTYGLYVPLDKMKVYNFSGFESELDCIRVVNALNDLEEKRRENGKIASKFLEENEQLKQELFESEKEWYECHYTDNSVRLDSKLEALKEEFKERFGRDFE